MSINPTTMYNLPPHPSSPISPSFPAPSFLVVLPSITRGFNPSQSNTAFNSRNNSLSQFPGGGVGSGSGSGSGVRDTSPSSPSNSIRGSISSSSGVGSGGFNGLGASGSSSNGYPGWNRQEMTAKLLDGKNSLFSSGDAAGERRRLSISALPMPMGSMIIGSRGGSGSGPSGGVRYNGSGLDSIPTRPEEEEDEEPGQLLGSAAEKLLNGQRDTGSRSTGDNDVEGLARSGEGPSPRSSFLEEEEESKSSQPIPPTTPTMDDGRISNQQYPGRIQGGPSSTLNAYEYPPRDISPGRSTFPHPPTTPSSSSSAYRNTPSQTFSPRSTIPSTQPSIDISESNDLSLNHDSNTDSAPYAGNKALPLPPPFGGFRRSTSHKGEFPDTPPSQIESSNIPPPPTDSLSSTNNPTAQNITSQSPLSGSPSRIRSSSPLNPPRARASRRRPQTSSAALSGFGFGSSSSKAGRMTREDSSPGGTDSETEGGRLLPSQLDSTDRKAGDSSSPLTSGRNVHSNATRGSIPSLGRTTSFDRDSPRDRRLGGGSTSSGRGKRGSMGSGRPGWEGEELVGVLREDGMQVTTLRTSSQMAQHLRHLTESQASARSPISSSFAQAAQQVPLHILLVPLSDSPTLPSLSLLLAQGTTPSAVCFQQDLLDRARRTEADWLPSALDMISMAARTSRRTSIPTMNLNLPRLLVVAYSANPALTPSVVTRCMEAGAIGVLQPPYDETETLDKIQQMVALAASTSVINGNDSSDLPDNIPEQPEPPELMALDKRDIGRSPSNTMVPKQDKPLPNPYASLAAYDFASRRKSIDTGGLALALKRASEKSQNSNGWKRSKLNSIRSEGPSPPDSPHIVGPSEPILKKDRSASLCPNATENPEFELLRRRAERDLANGEDTALAELLSEMYRQTKLTIDIQMADYEAMSAPISQEHRSRLIASMSTWDFRPHKLQEADVFRCTCLIFEAVLRIDGLHQLGINRDRLHRFLFALRAIYHSPNPYHNYIHALDVVQSSYTFMVQIGVAPHLSILDDGSEGPWHRPEFPEAMDIGEDNARQYSRSILRPQDVLAVMIAAMGHDVGHPGLSNAFMKNAKTPLSQVYQDKSVLENMHCMLVVRLLRKHGFGFLLGTSPDANCISALDGLLPITPSTDLSFSVPATPSESSSMIKSEVPTDAVDDFRGFKKILVETVLATDMSIHFAWIRSLQDLGKRFRAEEYVFPEDRKAGSDERDRIILCQAIIKCADISNPTRPIDISEHWSTVLLQEWAKQASLEQELSLPVSVVASADAALQAKGQIGFIDLFTLPLFEAAAFAMPDFQYFADACSENRATWQSRWEDFQFLEQEAALLQSANPPPGSSATLQSLLGEGSLPTSHAETREKRSKPVFVKSDEPTLSDERYKTLFKMSLPLEIASTVTPSSPSRPASAMGESDNGLLSSMPGRSESRSDGTSGLDQQEDEDPAPAMRLAYTQTVRRQTSKPWLGSDGSRKISGDGWKRSLKEGEVS